MLEKYVENKKFKRAISEISEDDMIEMDQLELPQSKQDHILA